MIKNYKVTVSLKDEIIHERVVRSKSPGTAATNVLTNHYRGNMDKVEVEEMADEDLTKLTADERMNLISHLTRPGTLTKGDADRLRQLIEIERKHQYKLGIHDGRLEAEEG